MLDTRCWMLDIGCEVCRCQQEDNDDSRTVLLFVGEEHGVTEGIQLPFGKTNYILYPNRRMD